MLPRRAAILLTAGVMACFHSSLASAQTEVDPGSTPDTALGPIVPAQEYVGAIEAPGDIDTFKFEGGLSPSSVLFTVSHTNDECEVWAQLGDADNTSAEIAFIPRDASMSLHTVAFDRETLYLTIATGPFRLCAGATYVLTLSLLPLPLDPAQATEAAGTLAAVLRCEAACSKASTLGVRRRKLIRKVRRLEGATKRRAARRLGRVTRRYRRARRAVTRWC